MQVLEVLECLSCSDSWRWEVGTEMMRRGSLFSRPAVFGKVSFGADYPAIRLLYSRPYKSASIVFDCGRSKEVSDSFCLDIFGRRHGVFSALRPMILHPLEHAALLLRHHASGPRYISTARSCEVAINEWTGQLLSDRSCLEVDRSDAHRECLVYKPWASRRKISQVKPPS